MSVDARGTGPVVRSPLVRALRVGAVLILVPTLFVTVVLIQMAMAIISSFMGRPDKQARPGTLRRYLGEALGHLTADRIRASGHAPITDVRLRDSAGQVFPLRVEGHLMSGALTPGDRVTIALRIVDGVYIVTGGDNHTSRQAIRIRA